MDKKQRPTATIAETLMAIHFIGAKIERTRSHDLRWLRGMRIEVKSARPHKNNGWLFHLEKRPYQKRWAKVFIFVAFDEEYGIERLYFVPRVELLGKNHIWIGADDPIAQWRVE